MPRFTFIVVDSKAPGHQPVEMRLSTEDDARVEAVAVLVGLAKDALPDGDVRDFSARVVGEDGRPLFEATLTFTSRWLDRD